MVAAVYDIVVEIGTTFQMDLVWKDHNGVPIDNTYFAGRMQFRQTPKSDVVLLEFSDSDGSLTFGGADGRIHISGLAEVSETITARFGYYDLKVLSPDGTLKRLIQGSVDFDPEITRSVY